MSKGHEAQKKQCRRAFLHSCECCLLLINIVRTDNIRSSSLHGHWIWSAMVTLLVTQKSRTIRSIRRTGLLAWIHQLWCHW